MISEYDLKRLTIFHGIPTYMIIYVSTYCYAINNWLDNKNCNIH